eukprot:CAMPEP_0197176390 /NCGR_PEP_ID=MMETSP1423-20130617/2341_1 /TAXON_ID=476441 /ORGANISM="Pseudo-nitzschia heimii, Strain UNC1101" /LENGTH=124 /DNA_ID=CAMNT_0042625769 /DNA_START=98 /DNA_END=472 /DNA_ORIENTATION=-
MKLLYSSLLAALFAVGMGPSVEAHAAHDKKPSCVDYTKGDFAAQTIDAKEICQTACQTAEGLPVGRFKTDEENPDYAKCTCINEDNTGKTTDTRDLCQDGSAGATPATLAAVVATALVTLGSMM